MSIEALTTEPEIIYAGDTINWLISDSDYPASSGWTLKYKAFCAGGYFLLTAAASGADHAVTAAKATTAAYVAGTYTLVKYVESLTETVTLAELPLIVKPALSAMTAAYDNRTSNEKILAAIDSALLNSASTDQLEITIDGTTIKRMSRETLAAHRNSYALAVWQERNPGQLAPAINLSYRDRYGC